MNGAIFLDRDGTINKMTPGQYITRWDDIEFLPGVLDALAFLNKNSERRIIIVTNQPAIGKGLMTWEQELWLHDRMQMSLRGIQEYEGPVIEVLTCPHTPEDNCSCRKPKPGLIYTAAYDYGIDLSKSVMVGDMGTDIQAAWAAGIPECYMLRCGDPRKAWPIATGDNSYEISADLAEAAQRIVAKERNER